jgi:hypothetical protein
VLLSLGAVKFTQEEVLDRFYVAIDPVSCERIGLRMDASTVLWWMSKDRALAREALLENGSPMISISDALQGFADWFGPESVPLWGNGATFDNVILRNAYTVAGMEPPWKFWHDRCHRTLKSLAPEIKPERNPFSNGIEHHALGDALWQVEQLQGVAKHLGLVLA